MVNEGLERLDQLAAKLNVAVESLWTVFVQQASVEAVQDVLLFLCSCTTVGALILLFKWIAKMRTKTLEAMKESGERRSEREEFLFAMMIVSGIVTVLSTAWVFCAVLGLTGIPTKLLNPEYWALKELLDLIR
jgi:cellobiose-specific phosphotransferase system component IIC